MAVPRIISTIQSENPPPNKMPDLKSIFYMMHGANMAPRFGQLVFWGYMYVMYVGRNIWKCTLGSIFMLCEVNIPQMDCLGRM